MITPKVLCSLNAISLSLSFCLWMKPKHSLVSIPLTHTHTSNRVIFRAKAVTTVSRLHSLRMVKLILAFSIEKEQETRKTHRKNRWKTHTQTHKHIAVISRWWWIWREDMRWLYFWLSLQVFSLSLILVPNHFALSFSLTSHNFSLILAVFAILQFESAKVLSISLTEGWKTPTTKNTHGKKKKKQK